MRLNDVIRKAVSVEPSDNIVTAARKMREHDASSCVVVESGRIMGVITERDLVTKIAAEERPLREVLCSDCMTAVGTNTTEQVQGRIVDLLGSPASSLEDAEGVYELALTGAPIDLTHIPGLE